MIGVLVLSAIVAIVNGRPSDGIVQQNVVTVPPNCPTGQEWVNGQCRDVWRNDANVLNVITVPPNCPPGQEYVNGSCRDVWIKAQIKNLIKTFNVIEQQNTVTVPTPQCKPGQQWMNGSCRDTWRTDNGIPKNVITVPPNCPPGQEFVNGSCRDVWKRVSTYEETENMITQVQVVEIADRNVISVPSQCPVGYKPDALGVCREIFP